MLLLIAGPIALLITGLGAWFLVRNALIPVARMRAKAESIGIDNLDERLSATNRHDEIGQLAHTLNEMLDRLEEGVAARRQLVADASHELRTPLTAMRAELDVAIRDEERSPSERAALASVRDDVDRMSRVTDNLLTLARADGGHLELLRSDVDLEDITHTAVEPLLALAAAKDAEPDRRRGDRPCRGRPPSPASGDHQHGRERDQVHALRWQRDGEQLGPRRRGRRHRFRRWDRHPGPRARARVPALLPR